MSTKRITSGWKSLEEYYSNSTEQFSNQLNECFGEYKHNVLGLIEVTKDEAKIFGNCGKVEYQILKKKFCSINSLQDKASGILDLGEEGYWAANKYWMENREKWN